MDDESRVVCPLNLRQTLIEGRGGSGGGGVLIYVGNHNKRRPSEHMVSECSTIHAGHECRIRI